MSLHLTYKDPDNGKIYGIDTGLVDVPPGKVKATIKEFKQLFKYRLPQDKDGEKPVHYALMDDVSSN